MEEYSYRYDMAGNKTEACKQRQEMDADSGSFQYGYDALNRLTDVSRDEEQFRAFTFDAANWMRCTYEIIGGTANQVKSGKHMILMN